MKKRKHKKRIRTYKLVIFAVIIPLIIFGFIIANIWPRQPEFTFVDLLDIMNGSEFGHAIAYTIYNPSTKVKTCIVDFDIENELIQSYEPIRIGEIQPKSDISRNFTFTMPEGDSVISMKLVCK